MRKFVFIILIVHSLYIGSSFSQSLLSFDEEDITFEIADSIFVVKGLYFFSALEEREYLLIYPFPTENIYGKPFDINITCINTSDSITYKITANYSSIIFKTNITNHTQLYITYKQHLKSNKAKYILTTTRTWKKPLKRAEYKLLINKEIKVKSFSITPDNTITIEDKNLYIWQKENFMPEVDFKVEF